MKGLGIGRTVHFILTPTGEHRPAIIVRVADANSGRVNLQVFMDDVRDITSGHMYRSNVPFDEQGIQQGAWHWPEVVS